MSAQPEIVRLDSETFAASLDDLAELLVDAVASGASVSFLSPLTAPTARIWYAALAPEVERGRRVVLVCRLGGDIVGCGHLVLAEQQNARHRAEVQKMIVHRRHRRRGVARMIMQGLESEARLLGRTLLHLDTEPESDAEHLYAHMGWQRIGVVPDFAMKPDRSGFRPSALWCRRLH